jgi:hypothetical protein
MFETTTARAGGEVLSVQIYHNDDEMVWERREEREKRRERD